MSKIDIKEVRCVICDNVGAWENVDKYRSIPSGMHICKCCGFVYYSEKYMSEDEAKAYYKEDYRKPPSIGNAFTGQRKLHMHSHFLSDLMAKWKEDKKEKPVVCDIGAAYGMFLNWFRSYFPEGEYYGTEFTESYRRNAWHEYNIKLDHDFDKTKKYDLIASFKVAEHQLDVDKRLREYVECLNEDGYIYISVPTWFKGMTNFGLEGFDLEYYYHPDHINVWTQKNFETLLNKVGLEVIKFDDFMYDETYLCQRNDSLMDKKQEYDNYDDIIDKLSRIKQAYDLYTAGEFEAAKEVYPFYFEAWNGFYEKNRNIAHKENQKEIPYNFVKDKFIDPCLKACNRNIPSLRFAVDLSMRYDKFEDAIEYIKESLEGRPNQGTFLMALSHCFRQLAIREQDLEKKTGYYKEARDVCRYVREIDMQLKDEATNWIYQDNSEMPIEQNKE